MTEMIVLPAVLESLKPARDFTATTAARHWGIDSYPARLVVNELLAHAVTVSPPDESVIVAAYTRAGNPIIEVWDHSPDPPATRPPFVSERPTAWGLLMLSGLITAWGTRRLVPTGTGKIAWCQIRR